MGEGAAVLVLEEWEHARRSRRHDPRRGAGRRPATPTPTTSPLRHRAASARSRACELALADAGLEPGDIKQINAHGTRTPLNDAAEAAAIAEVFGAQARPVVSTKGVTGHALGAAGALEAAAVLLSIEHRLIPPTANTKVDRRRDRASTS